ncbi:MAG: virulence factor BrkB family protein [Dokdonella sp.]
MIGRIYEFATSRYDREKVLAFFRFTWTRFLDDRCTQAAGALSYTTIFALVPLTAAILGILAAFPVFGEWRDQLTGFVFQNFVPAAGDVVQNYLYQFADNASKATAVGILVLFFSAIALMMSIEDAFNRIFRVTVDRRAGSRLLIYWTALSLGPLLVVAALAISSYLFALPFIDIAEAQFSIKARLLSVLPFLIVWTAQLAAYTVIPNRTVAIRHAAIGALIAAILFEGTKRGFAFYVTSFTSYQKVYGALAMVPVFIFWVYLSWLIVLFGASITASLSAFDYRPKSARLPPGQEFIGLLRVLGVLADAQMQGQGLTSSELRERESFLTDDLLQRFLGDLQNAGMVERTEVGKWVLVRNLSSITLLELYEEGRYSLPLAGSHGLGGLDETPGEALLHRTADIVRGDLAVPLSEIFSPPLASNPAPENASQETVLPPNPSPDATDVEFSRPDNGASGTSSST